MEASLENVKNDQFAKLVGIEIIEATKGHSLLEMKIEQKHLNGIGMVQGGAIFTLADYAFGVASNTEGISTIGINANIAYYKTPIGKYLRAEATEENTKNKICGYKVLVTDEDGSLVATMSGIGYRKLK